MYKNPGLSFVFFQGVFFFSQLLKVPLITYTMITGTKSLSSGRLFEVEHTLRLFLKK